MNMTTQHKEHEALSVELTLTEAEQKSFETIAIAHGMSGDIKVFLGEVQNFVSGDAA